MTGQVSKRRIVVDSLTMSCQVTVTRGCTSTGYSGAEANRRKHAEAHMCEPRTATGNPRA
jgi:hypothetical protein